MVYVGSKRRIAKYLKPIIEKELTNKQLQTTDDIVYGEPFVGGANLITEINWDFKVGSDINKYLIELLNGFKKGLNYFIEIDKAEYDKVKYNKDDYSYGYVGYVGYLASFGGAFFNGHCWKVKERNHQREKYNNIAKHSLKFKDINFIARDFKEMIIDNAVIYCDIPYRNTKKYNNTNFDYEGFYQWCSDMSKRNNTILLSEYENPDIEKWDEIWSMEIVNNGLNKYRTDTVKKVERLFKGKEQQ